MSGKKRGIKESNLYKGISSPVYLGRILSAEFPLSKFYLSKFHALKSRLSGFNLRNFSLPRFHLRNFSPSKNRLCPGTSGMKKAWPLFLLLSSILVISIILLSALALGGAIEENIFRNSQIQPAPYGVIQGNLIVTSPLGGVRTASVQPQEVGLDSPVLWELDITDGNGLKRIFYTTPPVYKSSKTDYYEGIWETSIFLHSEYGGTYHNLSFTEEIPAGEITGIAPAEEGITYTSISSTQVQLLLPSFRRDALIIITGTEEVPEPSSMEIDSEYGPFRLTSSWGNITSMAISSMAIDEDMALSFTIKELYSGQQTDITLELPYEIPEGIHLFLWEDRFGNLIQVPYEFSPEEFGTEEFTQEEFTSEEFGSERSKLLLRMRDGESDGDLDINGEISSVIQLYRPSLEPQIEIISGTLAELFLGSPDFSGMGGAALEILTQDAEIEGIELVEPQNIPVLPADEGMFAFPLLRVALSELVEGHAKLYIDSPALPPSFEIWSFNAATLEWQAMPYEVYNWTTAEIILSDGGPEDSDGSMDGRITAYLAIISLPEASLSGADLLQGSAEIGKPVKWTKQIIAENTEASTATFNLKAELPPSAENIIVSDAGQGANMPKDKVILLELGTTLLDYELSLAEEKSGLKLPAPKPDNGGIGGGLGGGLQEIMGALTGQPSEEEASAAQYSEISGQLRELRQAQPKDISFEASLQPNSRNEYMIEYYTEAPSVAEEITQKGKRITVSSATDYKDILTYTDISESIPGSVRLYWHASPDDYAKYILKDETQIPLLEQETYKVDITGIPEFGARFIDTNNDGMIDKVEWITPHLSSQTFEISITVLNPYTFVRDGETWIVAFNTTGIGDLIISSPNAGWAEFLSDNTETFDEMRFLDLKCGEESLSPRLKLIDFDGQAHEYSTLSEESSIDIQKLLIEDYECGSTGYITNHMLKAGYASLMLEFSDESATVTDYAYDAPVISVANITSNTSGGFYVISSLLGWCNTSNIGDVTYLWKWFRNGQLNSSGNEGYLARSYQETYDQTATTGIFFATQPGAYLIDGDWNTYARANAAADAIVYMNYTRPSGAVNQGTLWQVKDYLGTVNLTIPSACWMDPLMLRGVSYYGANKNSRRSTWACWDGATWQTLRTSTGDNLAANMYEEGVWWNLSLATYHPPAELINLGNITNGLALGQNWTFECTAYDGSTYSPAQNSSTITITNFIPTLTGPSISPDIAGIGSNLVCSANAYDLENTTLRAEWWWYKNGLLNKSGNTSGIQRDTNSVITTIGSGNLTVNDIWNCTVRITDGISSSPANSTKITIQNQPPNITQPLITPILPNSSSTLRCNVTPGDMENLTLTVEWIWYNGSVAKFHGNRTGLLRDINTEIATVGPTNLTRDDVWNCSARTFDGSFYSDWMMSSVLISSEPQPPEILDVMINPELAHISSNLICNATPTDRENTTLAVEWYWYKDGALNRSGNTTGLERDVSSVIATIGPGNTTIGEEWNCTVRAFDGTMYSNFSSAKTIISNLPPNISNVVISPSPANVTLPLTCNATPGDLENTTLAIEWWWYRNGELNTTGIKAGLQKNTNSLVATLGSGNLTPGDTWNCTVRTFDGKNYSEPISAQVTIQNILPTDPSVLITPYHANASSTLRCNVTPKDTENTTLAVEWQWYKNGELNTSGITGGLPADASAEVSSITPENLFVGDVWNCTARVFDGMNYSGQNTTSTFIYPSEDIPVTSPSFFMTDPAPSGNSNNQGFVDSNEFDEWPIELGDYGDTNQKCTLWDCSAWSSSTTKEVGMLCTSGWDCQVYNDNSCQQWACLGWSPNTRYYEGYAASGWSCGSMGLTTCDLWGPAVWQQAPIRTDMLCTGTWSCDSWDNGACTSWNCSSWGTGATVARDTYCSSGWECLGVTKGQCEGWSCASYLESGTNYADMYCSGSFSCQEWTGSTCTFWNCTQWSQYTALYDYSCDQWSCSDFNNMTKACNNWTCLSWAQGNQYMDNYCSGSYICTEWEDTTNMKPFFTALNITPSHPMVNETLTCNVTIWDVENSTVSVEWQWYKNGALNTSGTAYGVLRNTSTSVTTMGSGNLTIGDIWNCTVRAYDGMNYSEYRTTSVNVTPIIYPVQITINGTGDIDNTTIFTVYQGESIVARGAGNIIANLTKYALYDILVQTNISNQNQTEVRIINLNITGTSLVIQQQIITNYTGSKPAGINNISTIYVLNDTNLVFEKATIAMPTNNLSIDTIGHCTEWDYPTSLCLNWELNSSSDYNPSWNSTHIFFNVTHFAGYGAFSKGIDLIVTEINFSTSSPVEGDLILINVTVYNLGLNPTGTTSILELNISLYNGTLVPDQSIQKTVPALAGKGGTAVINFNWTAKPGTYIFNATADVLNELSESNETNNDYQLNYTVGAWELLYGKYNYSFYLAGESVFMNWSTAELAGTIYYSDSDSDYNPVDLRPLYGAGYLALADTALGMTHFNDSLSRLYDLNTDGMPDTRISMMVAGTAYDVPVINSTTSSTFITGIMYDSADGASYTGVNDLVFVTMLNMSQAGKFGTYDYEARLPSRLSRLKGVLTQITRLDEVS